MPTKRANGQGSVYKRGHYWVVQVVIGTNPKGSYRYKRKGGFRTKTEALEAIAAVKQSANEKPIPTVSYYYNVFSSGRGAAISDDKRRAYKIAYNRLEAYHKTKITDLTVSGMQEIVNTSCKTPEEQQEAYDRIREICR